MVRLTAQCGRQTVEACGIGRQAKPQAIVGPIETSAPDMPLRQLGMQLQRLGVPSEPKQWRASGNRKTCLHQDIVKCIGLLLQRATRAVCPWLIPERRGTDRQRRPGTRPRTQRGGDTFDHVRRTQGEPQPQSGKPIEFPERAQNQYRPIGAQRDGANGGIDIDERLVDNKPATTTFQLRGNALQRNAIGDATIGIVRIDDDHMNRGFRARTEIIDRDYRMTGVAPGERMFAVGRSDDRDWARRGEIRHQLNQCLGSRSDGNFNAARYTVGPARGRDQRIGIGSRRQMLPYVIRQMLRDRPRPGVDPGRQIEPTCRRAAMARDCLGEITTMLHACFMPSSALKREGLRSAFLVAAILTCIGLQSPSFAADLPRIASINLCTDQLLLALADPPQILGLSPYSRDSARSWNAVKAAQFPKLSGEAEDVLVLNPDAVVAGRFTKRATRELLKEKGLRVVEFDAARSLDDVKKQIRQMGDLVKHPDRAAAEIKRLDTAIAHAREVVSRKPFRVLALSRRGWVSGGDSLTSSLLATAGLANAATDLGYKLGGFASLETIISLQPDYLLVSNGGDFAEDEGSAFMLHPALERFYPPARRLVIPETLTVCGGPMLSEALDRLASELERVAN
jgi:iron complex transport system substrate-binding protein